MPRGTRGAKQSPSSFAYGTLTPSGRPFQQRSARDRVSHSVVVLPSHLLVRSTPDGHRRQPVPPVRFRLLPFRSPLLREYFLFLGVLRCFSSPTYLHSSYVFSGRVTGYHPGGVAPFGHPRISARPQLPEAFRRLATSFFGSRRRGIHRALVLRCIVQHIPPPPSPGLPQDAVNGTPSPTLRFDRSLHQHRCVDFSVSFSLLASHGAPMRSLVNVHLHAPFSGMEKRWS